MTYGQTDRRMNEGKIICSINFIRIWEHNQVIYSSLPIDSSSFKAPASNVFEIFCWHGKHAQIYKGPLLMKYFSEFTQKLIRSSTHYFTSLCQSWGHNHWTMKYSSCWILPNLLQDFPAWEVCARNIIFHSAPCNLGVGSKGRLTCN